MGTTPIPKYLEVTPLQRYLVMQSLIGALTNAHGDTFNIMNDLLKGDENALPRLLDIMASNDIRFQYVGD